MPKQKISSEQRHKFEEERARQILIYAFPEKYSTAKLSESPDIIVPERSIGVEVTDCTIQTVHEKMSYISGITSGRINPNSSGFKKHDNRDIAISTMPDGQHLAAFGMWGDTHNLIDVYMKKTAKLNQSHYAVFKENNLYITAYMMDDDELEEEVSKLLSYIRDEKTAGGGRRFDYVYVFTGKQLTTLRTKGHTLTKFTIPQEIMSEISEQAFSSIMEMSRDSFYGR